MANKPTGQLSLGLFEWDKPAESLEIDPPTIPPIQVQIATTESVSGSPGQEPSEVVPPVELICPPPSCLHHSGTNRLNVGPEIHDNYPPADYRPVSRDDLFLVPAGLTTEQEREIIQQRRIAATELVATFRKTGETRLAEQYLKDLGAYQWRLWELDHPVKECVA